MSKKTAGKARVKRIPVFIRSPWLVTILSFVLSFGIALLDDRGEHAVIPIVVVTVTLGILFALALNLLRMTIRVSMEKTRATGIARGDEEEDK